MDKDKIDQLETMAYIAFHEWQNAMAEQKPIKEKRYKQLAQRLKQAENKAMEA